MHRADGSKITVAGIRNDHRVWFVASNAFIIKDREVWVNLQAAAYDRPVPMVGARNMIDRQGETYRVQIDLRSVVAGTPGDFHVRVEIV